MSLKIDPGLEAFVANNQPIVNFTKKYEQKKLQSFQKEVDQHAVKRIQNLFKTITLNFSNDENKALVYKTIVYLLDKEQQWAKELFKILPLPSTFVELFSSLNHQILSSPDASLKTAENFAFFVRYLKRIFTADMVSSKEHYSFTADIFSSDFGQIYSPEELKDIRSYTSDKSAPIRAMANFILSCFEKRNAHAKMQPSLLLEGQLAHDFSSWFSSDSYNSSLCFQSICPFLFNVCKIRSFALEFLIKDIVKNPTSCLNQNARVASIDTTQQSMSIIATQELSQVSEEDCPKREIEELHNAQQMDYFNKQAKLYKTAYESYIRIVPSTNPEFEIFSTGFPSPELFEKNQPILTNTVNPLPVVASQEKSIDTLLDEFALNKIEDLSPKKNTGKHKKNRKAKSNEGKQEVPHLPSSITAQPQVMNTNPVSTTTHPSSRIIKPNPLKERIIRLIEEGKNHLLKPHSRLKRWRQNNVLQNMESFKDGAEFKYQGKSDQDKRKILIFHEAGSFLDSLIFHPEMKERYTYATEKGAGCCAEITCADGTVYRGVILYGNDAESRTCYHRCFEPRENREWLNLPMHQLFLANIEHPAREEAVEDDFYLPERENEVRYSENLIQWDERTGIISMKDSRAEINATIKIIPLR